MENQSSYYVIAVRFSKVGKLYHFEAESGLEIHAGDHVVVETARGWQLGEVAQIVGDLSGSGESSWKKIDRIATDADLKRREENEEKETELLEISRNALRSQNLEGVKIVSVELSLDGSRISVLYSYEGDGKIDLKNIKHEINKNSRNAQVELRQIGPRDVAKIFGGMGACGLPTRCCSKFLTDFSSISIRMAKEQGISLTPTEITGMCGRLRCCLIYEYEMYVENRKQLPKRKKLVLTPVGEGKVVDILPLKMAVLVDIPDVGRREFFNSDIQIIENQPQHHQAQHEQSQHQPSGNAKDSPKEDENKTIKNDQATNKESTKSTGRNKQSKNQQGGKGRKPRWRKRRPNSENKKNEE